MHILNLKLLQKSLLLLSFGIFIRKLLIFALETFSSFLKTLVLNTEKIDKYSTEKIDKLKNILTYDVGKCHNVVFGQG